MAKATALCTCKKCGATFERSTKKRNRKEADSWKEWAEANIDLCTACYHKQAVEEEQAKPLTVFLSLNPFVTPYCVTFSFGGGTIAVKEKLKELGYQFRVQTSKNGGAVEWIMGPNSGKVWTKDVPLDKVKEEIARVKTLTNKIINRICPEDIAVCRQNIAEQERRNEKIKEIPKPVRPSCYPKGRFNGKIYGSEKNGYCIYVDNEKIPLGTVEKIELEKYFSELKKYKEQIEKIAT